MANTLPQYNVGGNTGQSTENPAQRAAAAQTGIFKQIIDAIESLGSDVVKAVGFDRKNQDRGSASATPDVLFLNAQNTPPAATGYWGPDNPEIAYSHQHNNGPEFRFVGIQQWQPTAQGGNKNPPLFPGPALSRHSPVSIGRFPTFGSLTRTSNIRVSGTFTQTGVSGKKVLQDASVNTEPSGVSGGTSGASPSGGGSASSGGTSGGTSYHGGGRLSSF